MVVMLPEGSWYESDQTLEKYFFDVITILYTSRLKALGSNPLNNSRRVGTTVCLCFCIYDYSMFRGFEPGAFKLLKITMKNVKVSNGLERVSFRVVAHDATTELQDRTKSSLTPLT